MGGIRTARVGAATSRSTRQAPERTADPGKKANRARQDRQDCRVRRQRAGRRYATAGRVLLHTSGVWPWIAFPHGDLQPNGGNAQRSKALSAAGSISSPTKCQLDEYLDENGGNVTAKRLATIATKATRKAPSATPALHGALNAASTTGMSGRPPPSDPIAAISAGVAPSAAARPAALVPALPRSPRAGP